MSPEAAQAWPAPGPSARPFHRLLARAAQAQGARLQIEPRYRHLSRVVWPDGTCALLFGNALGLNSDAASALAADKTYTAQLLTDSGFSCPRGMLIVSDAYRAALALKNQRAAAALPDIDAPLRFAREVGFPVFVKPNSGSEGAGVLQALNAKDLSADLAGLLQQHTHVRVEQACPGQDLRVLVLNGQVRFAYLRAPLTVEGDGVCRVTELVAARLAELEQTQRGAKLLPDDPRLLRQIAAHGLHATSVPEKGRRIVLLPNANLSTGGSVTDVTDTLPQDTADLARRAAGALGLAVAGVDLLVPASDLSARGATVLEVNSAPGVDFYAVSSAAAEARALAFLGDAITRLRG